MNAVRVLRSEFSKAFTLPAVWIGIAVTVLGTAGIAALNSFQFAAAIRAGHPDRFAGPPDLVDLAFTGAPLGTVGAVIIGVLAVSSEYAVHSPDSGGGRQIATSLATVPRRVTLVSAKVVVVATTTLVTVLLAVPACLALARVGLGDAAINTDAYQRMVERGVGSGLYWILMALLAFGITLLARSGVIPLLVLIVNSALVSISLLLTNITPLAHWLPDMAGRNLFGFGPNETLPGGLEPVPGALVMAAWSVAAIIIGAVAFCRRDA